MLGVQNRTCYLRSLSQQTNKTSDRVSKQQPGCDEPTIQKRAASEPKARTSLLPGFLSVDALVMDVASGGSASKCAENVLPNDSCLAGVGAWLSLRTSTRTAVVWTPT